MKVVDLNLLLYAVNRDAPHHERAKAWLERTLSSDEPIALPWAVLLGFLRLTTNARVFPQPLSPEAALTVVDGWLAYASVIALTPGAEHWRILRSLLVESGTAGNLTTDAHLAALTIEHGAELCSADGDFARFRSLRWVNPLVEEPG
ncbi:MAG: type II toxin-antitoxin system VapC family toxin [Gemmatimonadetes bacterium]|nr:type II toxin-antitoxin system VapC family toxin [Gemmatimonadota bacterium]